VHQTANIFSCRRMGARDAMGFPGIGHRGLVWLGWSHVLLSLGEMWVIGHVSRVLYSDVTLQLSGMVGTRMTTVTHDDHGNTR
jgi:hypothetical protein